VARAQKRGATDYFYVPGTLWASQTKHFSRFILVGVFYNSTFPFWNALQVANVVIHEQYCCVHALALQCRIGFTHGIHIGTSAVRIHGEN
jgi:hypothetical protein